MYFPEVLLSMFSIKTRWNPNLWLLIMTKVDVKMFFCAWKSCKYYIRSDFVRAFLCLCNILRKKVSFIPFLRSWMIIQPWLLTFSQSCNEQKVVTLKQLMQMHVPSPSQNSKKYLKVRNFIQLFCKNVLSHF